MTDLRPRLRALGLHGLCARWTDAAAWPWVAELLAIEETERQRRSLERRVKAARLGRFKPIADFDWSWPRSIDRELVEDLFRLDFIAEAVNVILVGPNGVGKTMIAQNLVFAALQQGRTARFCTASALLADLVAQDGGSALQRAIRRYCRPSLLAIDELGYLSYDARAADLLFTIVKARADLDRPIVISTNKPFAEWAEVFPNAASVVALVDRLVHRSEIVPIEADSFRLHEAKLRAAKRKRS